MRGRASRGEGRKPPQDAQLRCAACAPVWGLKIRCAGPRGGGGPWLLTDGRAWHLPAGDQGLKGARGEVTPDGWGRGAGVRFLVGLDFSCIKVLGSLSRRSGELAEIQGRCVLLTWRAVVGGDGRARGRSRCRGETADPAHAGKDVQALAAARPRGPHLETSGLLPSGVTGCCRFHAQTAPSWALSENGQGEHGSRDPFVTG